MLPHSERVISIAAALKALEEQLLEPDTRRNAEALSGLLADDFREFGSSGRVFTKAEIVAELLQESYTRPELTHFEAKLLAAEVALVTYRTNRAEGWALRSSIWVYRDDRWQMVFHQGTKTVI